jgi:iron-sulfur cluster repair protein YtfE (RIC family)
MTSHTCERCTTVVTLDWTVNDVTRCFPLTIVVMNELGLDTCCGGVLRLDDAAVRAGLTPVAMMEALMPMISERDGISLTLNPDENP